MILRATPGWCFCPHIWNQYITHLLSMIRPIFNCKHCLHYRAFCLVGIIENQGYLSELWITKKFLLGLTCTPKICFLPICNGLPSDQQGSRCDCILIDTIGVKLQVASGQDEININRICQVVTIFLYPASPRATINYNWAHFQKLLIQ